MRELRIAILEDDPDSLSSVRLVVLGARRSVADQFAVVRDERRVRTFAERRLPRTVGAD